MECNKEEARRAINIAEKKLSVNDYISAKRFVNKARTLYPNLDGLEQVSTMIDVYISASNKNNQGGGGKELDWYGILAVDPLADEEALKRQYKKLALLLHPDKNRFHGAEGAFKLVLNAWSLLSDKATRTAYDQKRKSNEAKQKKSERPKPPQYYPASCNGNRNAKEAKEKKSEPKPQATSKPTSTNASSTSSAYYSDQASAQAREMFRKGGFGTNVTQQQRERMKRIFEEAGYAPAKAKEPKKSEPKPPPQHDPASCNNVNRNAKEASSEQEKVSSTFWTMCTRCWTYSEHWRAEHLDKIVKCPYCSMKFVAFERFAEMVNGKPFIPMPRQQEPQPSAKPQPTGESTGGASSTSSASDSAKTAEQMRERMKRLFEESKARFAAAGVSPVAAKENANEADRPFKKPVTIGNPYSRFEDPSSTHEAQRLFKKPTKGDPNYTSEAQRLYQKPMTTGNPNSTFEAQRLFSRGRWADVK